MKNVRPYLWGVLCCTALMLAQGCIAPEEFLTLPTCNDLPEVELGSCDEVVGYGRLGGTCSEIRGCTKGGLALYPSLDGCQRDCEDGGSALRITCTQILDGLTADIAKGKACIIDEHCSLVTDFGGCQLAVNNTVTQEALDEMQANYDVGGCYTWECEMTVGVPAAVCVENQCAIEWTSRDNPPATCDDFYTVELDTSCEGLLGWAVVNGSCELLTGCHTYDYGFYQTETACVTACPESVGKEQLCAATEGAWDAGSCGHYACGVVPLSCGDPQGGCNCGPYKNFSDIEGCIEETICTDPEPSCNDLLGTDWGSCSPSPLGAGVVNGECITIFGCEEPPGVYLYGNVEECEIECVGCLTNDDCDDGEYCHFSDEAECGRAGNGSCSNVAEICYQVYEPVCDCNGVTRSNDCTVAQDWPDTPASSIDYEGECMSDICAASGVEWDTDACGHYTCGEAPAGCGDPTGGCNCGDYSVWDDTIGQCKIDTVTCGPKPTCVDLSAVDFNVCSDTDTDTSNDSPRPLGAAVRGSACNTVFGCEVPPGYVLFESVDECIIECQGCQTNADCPANHYCDFPPESDCGAAGDGKCEAMGEVCTQVWEPVCNCNDITVSSACNAAIDYSSSGGRAAASVAYPGPCAWEMEDRCGTSGGTWDTDACDHYTCDVAPEACADPLGGCDCGPARKFRFDSHGCIDDFGC